ncbi:hypothetical protein N7481_012305 [Penicillium waksmanii]|uniref:uncharacterized protein n=1 Tax=Penicillium waksmanii TaxID=69791 RepID=UPI0025469DB8|nr:uncharacterized protein N7481_012305 [Penicillium waksmanii]KAJ5965591.1 hypothetical protein N7481_012305 [Penicillium waksmanii]
MPLSHLTLTVSHLPTSTSFFLSCLQPLGYQFIGRHDDYIGFGQKQGEPADFWVTEQKPGISTSAVHVAFPAPTKDAVKTFFISALKAGGKMHGEPKTRDSQSGYYSAAIIDFDGNSIEAVYRPGATVVASEVGGPTIALLENGSVVSKSSKATTTVSKATTTKRTQSIAPPVSEAGSRAITKAPTAIERGAPSVVSHQSQSQPQARSIPPPSYTMQTQTIPKTDDGGKAAKTIVGTLLGAAAGAAIAYAMVKGDSQSTTESETKSQTNSQTKSQAPGPSPSQYVQNFAQLMAPSQALQQEEQQQWRAIEAPPARSVYTSASGPRSTMSRSVASKNPRASTIYEATEFYDDHGRRASDGSVFSIPEDIPLRAIEYPPQGNDSQRFPCSPSTFISSYAADKPRSRSLAGPGSVHSASTIKASQAQSTSRRHSQDDRNSYTSSHHSRAYHTSTSTHSRQGGKPSSKAPNAAGSTASSTRSARNIPLPAGSAATYYSAAPSHGKSHLSAREVPLPDSVIDLDVRSNVTPDDSISQVGSRSDRSHHSHHSHRSHSKAGSKHSSKSKYGLPVIPADSVSQASSQHTVKAGGSRVHSHSGSRRGSQVV